MTKKTKSMKPQVKTVKKITADVMFLIGRGEGCTCSDCPVLYGGECLTGKTPKQRLITKRISLPLKTSKKEV